MTTSTEPISLESLSKLSFILHYRKDCEDRESNLKASTSFIRNKFPNSEIIVVNDDAEVYPEVKERLGDHLKRNKIKYLFLQNDDEFKKSEAFNGAAALASGEILCFWDVDVLIHDSYIKIACELINDGGADHVYPFNGTFVDIQKDLFQDFLTRYNFEYINELWKAGHPSLHFASDSSPGGCTMISKDAFYRMGGYDNRFIGWGFEDTDFLYRSRKVNRVSYIQSKDAICWHLHHENAKRTENPHYNNNLMIFNQNAAR
jgi:predicted glycosyltransferase involved in capsule biosynthesis